VVDTELVEFVGNGDLVAHGKVDPLGLLAVPQGAVVEIDAIGAQGAGAPAGSRAPDPTGSGRSLDYSRLAPPVTPDSGPLVQATLPFQSEEARVLLGHSLAQRARGVHIA